MCCTTPLTSPLNFFYAFISRHLTVPFRLVWISCLYLYTTPPISFSAHTLTLTPSLSPVPTLHFSSLLYRQRPFLLSSVAIIGLEMLTEHKWFAPLHLVFLLVVIAVVYLITLTDPARTLKQVGGRWSRRRPKPEEEEVALT